MTHLPIQSSFIKSVGHDPETSTLEVKLKSGHTYQYDGVPEQVHADLINATSVGAHYNNHIVGQYPSTRI